MRSYIIVLAVVPLFFLAAAAKLGAALRIHRSVPYRPALSSLQFSGDRTR